MSKSHNTKLTLNDLIAKKAEKANKRNKTEDVYLDSLGGMVTIRVPEDRVILKAMDMMKDETIEGVMQAYVYAIYYSVDLFQDPKLHEEYEVQDPTDIVVKLLDLGERLSLGDQIMKLSGLADIDKTVKK